MTRIQRRSHARRPLARLARALPLAALVLGLATACAGVGAGAGSDDAEILVSLKDFKSGTSYELASESHTDRVSYYSDARDDAARKVQTDEIMSAFVGELRRQGFGDHAREGPAPSLRYAREASAGVNLRWGLEVQHPGGTTHWLVTTGSSPDDWKDFQRCRDTFLQLYNITVSYQAVENDAGRAFFEGQEPRPGGGR